MTRNFDAWLATMHSSINTYKFYVDFDKIYKKVDAIKIELNILNSLIGSKNIEEDFRKILMKYPETLKCIPILLAIRLTELHAQDEDGSFDYRFDRMNYSIDQYLVFMKKTGLLDLIANHIVNNLVDYALGIETGLDSNARKNRGGHQMESLVENFIKKTDVEYYREMYLSEVEKKWGLDLSAISAEGTSTKRWDFVVKTSDTVYLVETNFYSGGGSKLNEVARSYKMIAEESQDVQGAKFVWITDGSGWRSARRNLKETFDVMDTLYDIADLEDGALDTLFQ